MLAPSTTTTLDQLLLHVDRYGMAESGAQIDQLIRFARHHAVATAVVDALTDETAPMVLRERALARIVADLRAVGPELAPIAA